MLLSYLPIVSVRSSECGAPEIQLSPLIVAHCVSAHKHGLINVRYHQRQIEVVRLRVKLSERELFLTFGEIVVLVLHLFLFATLNVIMHVLAKLFVFTTHVVSHFSVYLPIELLLFFIKLGLMIFIELCVGEVDF